MLQDFKAVGLLFGTRIAAHAPHWQVREGLMQKPLARDGLHDLY